MMNVSKLITGNTLNAPNPPHSDKLQRLSLTIDIKDDRNSKKSNELTPEDFVVSKTRWETVEECVIFRQYKSVDFCVISFSRKCTSRLIKIILQAVINVGFSGQIRKYQFFGYSHNQLKERKCVLYNNDIGKHEDILKRFGRFDKILEVSKRAARIGLLFSTAQSVSMITQENVGVIADITIGKYTYTDGCGLISVDVANSILQSLKMKNRYIHQDPPVASVYQIRFQGCKGVLMVDPGLQHGIKLRQSMIKFEWNCDSLPGPYHLCIVPGPGISRPYKVASLNLQFTRLLSTLGTGDEIFLVKTVSYLNDIKRLDVFPGDIQTQIRYLCAEQYFTEAELLIECKTVADSVEKALKSIKRKIIRSWEKIVPTTTSEKTTKTKLKIPIEYSRNAYGVCDPSKQLQYGECFFQPTLQGKPTVLDNIKVIVCKNPCYHPGDVRVLICKNIPDCHHLVDCVVFPVSGKRPHCNEIAGSDLDGDEYFVCWDQDLIPPNVMDPSSYEGSSKKKQPKSAGSKADLIHHFADYRSNIAEVNDLYELWASSYGAGCPQCLLLANLFSVAVDSAKTGDTFDKKVLDCVSHIKERPQPKHRFIWDQMIEHINLFRHQQLTETIITEKEDFDLDSMKHFLDDKTLPTYSFNLFRLLMKWMKGRAIDNETAIDLLKKIDFSHFLPEQRKLAIYDVHEYGQSAIDLVSNSLYRSDVLLKDDILAIQGITKDSTLEWVLEDQMPFTEFTWEKLNATMIRNSVKMVIFQIHNFGRNWVLALTIREALELYDTVHPQENKQHRYSQAYISVHDQNVNSRFSPLKDSYLISLDGTRLQIYNSEAVRRTDTFICLMDLENGSLGMSVALEKFKGNNLRDSYNGVKVNRHEIQKVEVFVRHRKPYSTQHVHLFQRNDDEDASENNGDISIDNSKQSGIPYAYKETEFPTVEEWNKFKEELGHHMNDFDVMRSVLLEEMYSGTITEGSLEAVSKKLTDVEFSCDAAVLLEYVISECASILNITATDCVNIIKGLLQITQPQSRIERLLRNMVKYEIKFSMITTKDLLLSLLYEFRGKENAIVSFLNILRSNWPLESSVPSPSRVEYLLKWWSLLTIEQYHQLYEAEAQAHNQNSYYMGSLFLSKDGDENTVLLNIESAGPAGVKDIKQTDGLALTPGPVIDTTAGAASVTTNEPQLILYNPVFYFGINGAIGGSVYGVDLVWPRDVAILSPWLKNDTDKRNKWRVDIIPNLVTYNRMMTALEAATCMSEKNQLIGEILVDKEKTIHSITATTDTIPVSATYANTDTSNLATDTNTETSNSAIDTNTDRSNPAIDKNTNRSNPATDTIVDTTDSVKDTVNPAPKIIPAVASPVTETTDCISNNIPGTTGSAAGTNDLLDKTVKDSSDGVTTDTIPNTMNPETNTLLVYNKHTADPSVETNDPLGDTYPDLSEPLDIVYNNAALNDSQNEAVQAALCNSITLVQGPPGTGKTVTAARLVEEWLKRYTQEKILVCAETNEGVNNMVKALLKIGIPCDSILRVGANVPEELVHVSLECQLQSKERKYKHDDLKIKAELLSKTKVICTTCIGAGCTELQKFSFRKVLIDEAAQAMEPATLVPLCLGVNSMCLVGDDQQLPPLVMSKDAEELKESLFSKLATRGYKVHMLNTQYRMHPCISKFPAVTFYKGKLKDGVIADQRRLPEAYVKLFGQHPLVFIDVQICGRQHNKPQCGETHEGPAIYNCKEVAKVKDIINQLINGGVSPSDITVISPYRKQVEKLQKDLGDKYNVQVKTIDGFQGQEREIIIFSAVRANVHPRSKSKGHVGHLGNRARMNVALTRARTGLIVVGNRDTIQTSEDWNDWLKHVDKNGLCMEDICPTTKPPTSGRKQRPKTHPRKK